MQIVIHPDDVHASQDNEALVELAASGGAASAQATCANGAVRSERQDGARNRCCSRARGGRLERDDVTFITHKSAGGQTRRLIRSLFMKGTEGQVRSGCGQQAPSGHDPRDNCVAEGVGGSIDLRAVDVTAADGTRSTDVRVSVRGGNADASVYCFNYVRPGTDVRRSNTCSATSQGGKATLRHVTIEVFVAS